MGLCDLVLQCASRHLQPYRPALVLVQCLRDRSKLLARRSDRIASDEQTERRLLEVRHLVKQLDRAPSVLPVDGAAFVSPFGDRKLRISLIGVVGLRPGVLGARDNFADDVTRFDERDLRRVS